MRKLFYVGIAVAVVVAAGLIVFYEPFKSNDNSETQPPVVGQPAPEAPTDTNADNINFSDDGKTVTYSGEEGKTALEVLQERTEVTTKTTDFGDQVTGINGVEADPDTEFWAFYVNGELANEGAGTYESSEDDTIEWRLDKIEL